MLKHAYFFQAAALAQLECIDRYAQDLGGHGCARRVDARARSSCLGVERKIDYCIRKQEGLCSLALGMRFMGLAASLPYS
jgi:hypothetical protein